MTDQLRTQDLDQLTPDPDEHLATGWEPWVEPGDTVVRNYLAAVGHRLEASVRVGGGRSERTEHAAMFDQRSTYLFDNIVLVPEALDPDQLAQVAEGARRFFGPSRAWTLLALTSRGDLRGAGLELVGHPPLMYRPAGGLGPDGPVELEIRRVDDEVTLADFERTLVEAYPLPSADSVLDPRTLGESSVAFLGYLDGEPAATAGSHTAHGMSEIEWVSTRPECRGRGVGAALTWAATDAVPDCPSVLVATDDGRPVYERLGYVAVLRMSMWLCPG